MQQTLALALGFPGRSKEKKAHQDTTVGERAAGFFARSLGVFVCGAGLAEYRRTSIMSIWFFTVVQFSIVVLYGFAVKELSGIIVCCLVEYIVASRYLTILCCTFYSFSKHCLKMLLSSSALLAGARHFLVRLQLHCCKIYLCIIYACRIIYIVPCLFYL